MPDPNLEAVNHALSATVQKQEVELKTQDATIRSLRRALLSAAEKLELANWHQSAAEAREAAL